MRDRFETLLQGKLRDHASAPSEKVWERIERDLPMGDTLENALQSKLYDHTAPPPAEIWERIERDLPSVVGMSRPATGSPSSAPRRPMFHIMVRYAVAASLLAAAIVTASIYTRPETPQPPITLAPEVTIPAPPVQNVPETICAPETPTQIPEMPKRPTLPTPSTAPKGAKPVLPVADTMVDNPSDPESPQTGESSAPQNTQSAAPAKDPQPGSERPVYTQEHFAASNATRYKPMRGMGDAPSMQRRLSISLYAANLGGGSSNGEIGNRASWNGYQLTEVVSRAMANDQQAYYSAPTVTKAEHRIPLSFGLGVSFDLSERLSLESGLTYSFLRSDFHAEGSASASAYDIRQELHYLGVPVALLYRFAMTGPVDFYLRGGGMLEKGINGERRTQLTSSKKTTQTTGVKMLGVQPLLSASLGFQIDMTPALGLYFEPGVNYYPGQDDQPESYRTENPVTFGLKAGLRINFGRNKP